MWRYRLTDVSSIYGHLYVNTNHNFSQVVSKSLIASIIPRFTKLNTTSRRYSCLVLDWTYLTAKSADLLINSVSTGLPIRHDSDSCSRMGTGPTPPKANRTSLNCLPLSDKFTNAARHTVEMTSDRLCPTFSNADPYPLIESHSTTVTNSPSSRLVFPGPLTNSSSESFRFLILPSCFRWRVSSASIANIGGVVSAAGEALTRFPPSVACSLIWSSANQIALFDITGMCFLRNGSSSNCCIVTFAPRHMRSPCS